MRYYTTPEQSKILLEIGIKSETAPMHYERLIYDDAHEWGAYLGHIPDPPAENMEYLPCWTLADLMDLLPSSIISADALFDDYYLDIAKSDGSNGNPIYNIAYVNERQKSHILMVQTLDDECLIDAVIDMLVLIDNQGLGENINNKP